MPTQAVMAGNMMCSFGMAPSTLISTRATKLCNTPMANMMDYVPFQNIVPFGMCMSPSNPAVAAALGVPQACTPSMPAPWVPGDPQVLIDNLPSLNNTSTCMCAYAGVAMIVYSGQTKMLI